ncbi:hypothetical protein UB33_05955 [Photobacterium angustum]|uniref:D-glucuronyl C5-epimerase family protein n=1 Tax=Photobacterium angustum TaxID=661 RepID=UPI0005DF9740|nr:D-glucuronyl C5-epimerase family protein [Photobacterium angustum]KJF92738.1 hypothetical protein UB39_19015 [Photobacterium angustum]KJG07217.1 hypothetical protein UB33_05955 [Photobacterium angustum]PSV90443.1 hypothetical protein CTN01_16085 [Photobacterium angustum]PSW83148.1 hypothetical protein CTN03_01535 [Photobacterium angustum]
MLSHGKLVTALQFFTPIFQDYWHIIYPVNKNTDGFNYYLDNSKKATTYKGEFNSEGIYLFFGYDGKYHEHALESAQYGLACWEAYHQSKNNSWKIKALKQCDWLVSNQSRSGAWFIEHKNSKYETLPSPWSSALAQGFAISSLVRAYKYTKNDNYLQSARIAFNYMNTDIAEGGLKRFIDSGGYIYEEYPTESLNGVLNGYIFVLFSIMDLASVDESYELVLQDNIKNLRTILPLFDAGFWSYYSLDGNISSGFYHRLVIRQLEALIVAGYDFSTEVKIMNKQLRTPTYVCKAFLKKVLK